MRRLHLVGDSHLNQIWGAWNRIAKAFDPLTFGSDCFCIHGANIFDFELTDGDNGISVYSNRVAEEFPNTLEYKNNAFVYNFDQMDDVYVFASPLHSAQIYRHSGWKEFCPWECATAHPDLQALSTSVLTAWFEAHIRRRLELLRAMNRRGFRVAVVEPPKPLARVPVLFSLSRDIVQATDRLYRKYVKAILAENDIVVISVPEHTHVDGFTTEEYSYPVSTDAHHGSFLFRAEMMIRILDFAVDRVGTASDHTALERFKCGAGKDLKAILAAQ